MTQPAKIFCLVPSERSQPCPHKQFAWTGRVPCTGRVRCPLCGTAWIDITTAEAARAKATAAIPTTVIG